MTLCTPPQGKNQNTWKSILRTTKRERRKEAAGEAYVAVYEPEQFAGAICRLTELPEIAILLFASGKAVITGIRDPDHLDPIVKGILHFLNQED